MKEAKPESEQAPKELEWLHASMTLVNLAPAGDGDGPDGEPDNDEDVICTVQWYTGATVPRYDYNTGERYSLTLSMEPGACDLSRLNNGAPLLNNHSSWSLDDVIGVVEDGSAYIENGIGFAKVRFSNRADLSDLRADVKAGIIRNVSVGLSVLSLKDITPEEAKQKSYLATKWQPMEISAVPIGADAGAGFLSHQIIEPSIEGATAQKETTLEPKTTGAEAQLEATRQEGILAERARVKEIRAALAKAKITDEAFAASLIDNNVSLDAARAQIIDKVAEQFAANPTVGPNGVQITRDAQETLAASVENALEHRVNPSVKLEVGRQFAHMSLLEMGRTFLESKTGQSVRGMSRSELATLLLRPTMGSEFQTFAPGYLGTTDYPNILANVFNKSLRNAYQAETQTFKPLGKRGTAPDFKQMNRIQIGDVTTMKQIGANGEFSYATNGDAKEVYSLVTYGQIVAVNRQTLINDDLSALTRLPESVGRSAARLESDVFWAILLANANMGDGVALFNAATHGNYTSSGTVISVTSLGVGRQSLRKQTGLNGVGYLNLAPRYLVVPPELETIAQQFTVQTNIIYTKSSDFNPFANSLQVVPEPRLSGGVGSNSGSTTAWYLFAEPGMIDTIEYSYLEGQEGVYMETRMGFDVDGMELKGRLDFAAKALDWRGMYKNAGA